MARHDRFPRRYLVYIAAVAYLLADLQLFHGPLWKLAFAGDIPEELGGDLPPDGKEWDEAVVVVVNEVPITRAELDREIEAHLFARGQQRKNLEGAALAQVEAICLEGMVAHQLIRMYSPYNPVPFDEAEGDRALARFRAQFASEENFIGRLGAQGLDVEGLRKKLRDEAFFAAWVEARIADAVAVDDSKVDNFLAAHPHVLRIEEAVRVRHLFLSGFDQNAGDREAEIRQLHARLLAGEEFATLVAAHSEDERSKSLAGDLGFLTRDRIPEDIAREVFALNPNELSAPFRSRIGWHIAQVTEHRAVRDASPDDVREEVRAHLEAGRRPDAVRALIRTLRERAHIVYLRGNLAKEA